MNLTLLAAVRLMLRRHYVYRIGSHITLPPAPPLLNSDFVKNAACIIELRILKDGSYTML